MLNKTSLGFILVFIVIIAISLSLFQVIAHFSDSDTDSVPAEAVKAEPEV